MKKWFFLLAGLMLLGGCSNSIFDKMTGTQTIIDWVDFIKWKDKSYDAIYDAVLADESYIGGAVGKVAFKGADNVTNTNYKTKNGDAAFHEKGTEIFAVKGEPDLLAVKDNEEIGGYRLYYTRETAEYKWHFQDVPLEDVKRIEFYSIYNTAEGNKLVSTWKSPDDIQEIEQLLASSREQADFSPNTAEKDPDYYQIILFTDRPVAYRYNIQFDGETYYWFPWETNILSADIAKYMMTE